MDKYWIMIQYYIKTYDAPNRRMSDNAIFGRNWRHSKEITFTVHTIYNVHCFKEKDCEIIAFGTIKT